MSRPDISLMIHTASIDSFMAVQNIPSYFTALADSLRYQTYPSFELVYVDTFYEVNREKFQQVIAGLPYRIKHVPIHHEHRYWFDKGYCYISAAKNTGILYADGELLITCDDAEFFPQNFLELYWHYYKHRGVYMHALHKRMEMINVSRGLVVQPLNGNFYINDKRWRYVENGPHMHRHRSMCYAGTSMSLEDALQLNGFNERMDGCKSLEDCDFGNRLKILGRSFVMDPDGWAAIVDHPNYSDMPKTPYDADMTPVMAPTRKSIESFIAVENFGMFCCAAELLDIVANKGKLTKQHIDIIRRETLRYREFDPLAPENADKFAIWSATPTFDLRQQRQQLRESSDWRW